MNVILPEPGAERILRLDGCGTAFCDLPPFSPGDGGQVLSLSLHLTDVLPGRQVAAAVQLEELDREGEAFPRGTKTFLLPPQPGPEPSELLLPSIRFVLPAELELDPGGPRRLRVRADAHYVQQGERCILPPA